MSQSLRERLRQARHFNFVGRSAELAVFQSAFSGDTLKFNVLHVFGPGGVGKSTLLQEFIYACEQQAIPAFYLDARNIDPIPDNFTLAVSQVLQAEPGGAVFDRLAAYQTPVVLLLDTYETITPLDDWLREVFLPRLPQNVLVVFAGRNPPSRAWRADPGWQDLLAVIALRNLSPDEGRAYLARRQIPAEQQGAALTFAHGHPLALSLIADLFAQRGSFHFEPEATLDIVKTLLENFVQKVPSPAHRVALEVCALVYLVTEALLATLLEIPDAHELFEWLRGLSFIEMQREGLFPHDLAREALVADLRWRNPAWYTELHRRARTYCVERFNQTSGAEQQRVLFELIYLHRENPMVQPFFEWKIGGNLVTDVMRPEDIRVLQAMVVRHEGEAAARIASYYFSRLPQAVLVWRDPQQIPVGFLMSLPLHEVAQDMVNDDPAVRATWLYLQNHAPLRKAEVATLFRFWMASDTYQAVSPVQSLIFVNIVRHYLATPGLAYTFIPCADANFWSTVFAYADLNRIRSADFTVGEGRYGIYGHDWRAVPPITWLSLLAERELSLTNDIAPKSNIQPLIVLSQEEFVEAVRSALHDFTQPNSLRNNPLLRSRLVRERAGGQTDWVSVLQTLLRETLDLLQRSPRQMKAYRALYHTFIEPAPTQERAAEILDLPFSTYRRHLKSGLDWLIEYLWKVEVGDLKK
jgi:hypothetical protein